MFGATSLATVFAFSLPLPPHMQSVSKPSPSTSSCHHRGHYFGICHLYFSPGHATSSMAGPQVHPHSLLSAGILLSEAVLWDDHGASQEVGRQCSSREQQEATAPWVIEVTGGITTLGGA